MSEQTPNQDKDTWRTQRGRPSELLQEQLPHNSYYYTGFWGSYKGYVKGALGGIAIGAALGAMIGLGAVGITAAAGVSIALAEGTTLVGLMGALGMLKGYHEFASIGSSAGVGVTLDEFEVRQNRSMNKKLELLYQKMAALNGKEDDVKKDIAAHPFAEIDKQSHLGDTEGETPHQDAMTHPTTKLFHWKVAAIGLAVGLAAGALLIYGGPLLAGHVFAGMVEHGALTAGLQFAGMAAAGLFGASFGVDRIFYRKIFDFTDRLFYGKIGYKLKDGQSPDLHQDPTQAPSQPLSQEPAPAIATHQAPAKVEGNSSQKPPLTHEERVMVVKHTETIVTRKKHGNWKDFAEAQKVLSDLDPNTAIRH